MARDDHRRDHSRSRSRSGSGSGSRMRTTEGASEATVDPKVELMSLLPTSALGTSQWRTEFQVWEGAYRRYYPEPSPQDWDMDWMDKDELRQQKLFAEAQGVKIFYT